MNLEFFGTEPAEDYYGQDLPTIDVADFYEKTFDNLVDHYNM